MILQYGSSRNLKRRSFFAIVQKYSLLQLAVIFWATAVPTVQAFCPSIINQSGSLQIAPQSLTRTFNEKTPSDSGDTNAGAGDGSFDVDSVRKQLQALIGEDSTSDTGSQNGALAFDLECLSKIDANDDEALVRAIPPPPPLSTIERDRRVAEISMLEQLVETDSIMPQLWNLWYSERGGQALTRLQQADQLMADPTSWQDCETSLWQLIAEHGVYFVEPLNRLATLYFLQGKLDNSYKLCKLALEIKPWHVGALSGVVQVCIGRGDRDGARKWAMRRLPSSVAGDSFPPFDGADNPRRAEWIKDMVARAQELLEQAERTTQKRFGKPEDYYTAKKTKNQEVGDLFDEARAGTEDDEEGAWQ